jgi:hypothetical protein
VSAYLILLEKVLLRLKEHNVRLNLNKCTFMAKCVRFCGKEYSQEGICYDHERVKTLLATPVPIKAVDLGTFLNSLNWNRDAIPRFAEVSSSLYELMEMVYAAAGARTKESIRRVTLTSRWTQQHSISFHMLKQLLATEVQRDYPRDGWSLFLFCDASDLFWAGCLMQAPPVKEGEDEDKMELETRSFRVLSFTSGKFKGAATRWDTQSKEAFAILASLQKLRPLLVATVTLVSDHANLKWILQAPEPSLKKVTQARILRMRETLGNYQYKIRWHKGSTIPFVDFYTRGGVAEEDVDNSLLGGFANDVGVNSDGSRKQVAALFISSASSDDFVYPTMEEFYRIDENLVKEELGLMQSLRQREDGCWEWQGKVYPPTLELRQRLLTALHSGIGGHLSAARMMLLLRERYAWPGMGKNVQQFCGNCFHCISSRDGDRERRPFGEVIKGDTPNQVIQIDHLFMDKKSISGMTQLLVITDTFSDYTVLYAVRGTTAKETTEKLVHYFSLFGVPQYVATDSGAAFLSELLRSTLEALKVEKHVVTPYLHTGLSIVERANKTTLSLFKRIMSELRVPPGEWDSLIGVVQQALNAQPREGLAGYSPAELFLGHQTKVETIFIDHFANLKKWNAEHDKFIHIIEDYVKQRDNRMKEAIAEVAECRSKKRHANDEQHKGHQLDSTIRGLVLKRSRATGKLNPRWTGPYIIDKLDDKGFKATIRSMDGNLQEVHVAHLRNFTVERGNLSEELLREQAGYMDEGFMVEDVLEIADDGEGGFVVLIKWEGYSDTANTWEPVQSIYHAAEEKIKSVMENMDNAKEKKRLIRFIKNLGGDM